jgi:hypothetical protein
MEALRRAHRLTRLVLAWFALSVGIAIAAPVVQPQSLEMVCSGTGGMKMMVDDQGALPDPGGHMKDCRLCVMTGAPVTPVVFIPDAPPAQAPAPVLPVPVVAQAAVHFSARAPPLL